MNRAWSLLAVVLVVGIAGCGGSAAKKTPRDQWVGGSDIHVPAASTATAPIKLTALGRRLAQSPGGYTGAVSVQIRVYGGVGWRGAPQGGPPLLIHG